MERFHKLEPGKWWHLKEFVAEMKQHGQIIHIQRFAMGHMQTGWYGGIAIGRREERVKIATKRAYTVCQDAPNLAGPT